jgi:AcrR family transcriptional regulator
MTTETSPKAKLFQTAMRLFYQNGYRAIGVDTIAAESGISKMTLYRHYPSKDDLIAAYLRHSNEVFWLHFAHITNAAPTPREQLLAFFSALQAYVASPACYGCPFLNVATEYPDQAYAGHQLALEHKQAVRAKFHQLAREAGARQPAALGDALFLLMDGAYMAARMFGATADNPAANVAAVAADLIRLHCQEPQAKRSV